MSDRPQEPEVPGWADVPAPPPPPPPPPSAALTIESETPVRAGGIGGRIVAGAIGLVLLLGGVGFAATQLGGSDRTPDQAVQELFDAIADEDVLGVLATLDPGEREVLTSRVEDTFAELERLEVLDESFELSGVRGVDLEFSDLTFRTEEIRGDLVRVYLTGGTASYDVNTDELPVGDFLADTLEGFGVEYRGHQDSDSDTLTPEEADDTFVVVRDTSDGWRISIGYTAVEAARAQSGGPVPSPGSGLAPVGADSPTAAVEGFLRAAAAFDVPGVVARTSPDELGALQDYWRVLVSDEDLAAVQELDVELELTELELRETTEGDRAQVFIDAFGVDYATDGGSGGFTIADGCISLRGDAQEGLEDLGVEDPADSICQDDLQALAETAMEQMGGFGMGFLGPEAFAPDPDQEVPTFGITATQVDGKWFVAPIGTFADAGIAVLEVLDRADLDTAVDTVESFFGAGFFGSGTVGGGFVPPGMTDGGVIEEFEDLGGIGEDDALGDGFQEGVEVEIYPAEEQALLREFVHLVVVDDPEAAECVLGELFALGTDEQLTELAESYESGIEPSMATQDLFASALDTCGQ